MVLTILVACDLYGEKQNTAFEFPAVPTIAELTRALEQHYDAECTVRRPSLMPNIPFRVAAMQVYSELEGRWQDVKSPSQITDRCQMYAFQKDHGLHADKQGTIPQARITVRASALGIAPGPSSIPTAQDLSTSGGYGRASGGITPGGGVAFTVGSGGSGVGLAMDAADRVKAVFDLIDTNRNAAIEFTELKSAMQSIGIEPTADVLEGIFGLADSNNRGMVSLPEWQTFTRNHATALVEALYHRLTARDAMQQARDSLRILEDRLTQRRQREAELRQQLADVQREVSNLDSQWRDQEGALRRQEEQRRRIEEQERALIQREIDILSRRVQLLREEQSLRDDVRTFYDASAGLQGTPRRGR